MGRVTECRCDGSGKISYRIDHSDEPWRDIGGGLQIGGGVSYTTELCGCRRSLPPRDGDARWWSSRTENIEDIQLLMFDEQVRVQLAVEVPIDEENYVVHRRGDNVYHPVSVQLHVTSNELNWLFPDEARAIAAALVRAADRADELDGPLADPAPAEDGESHRKETEQSALSS